ncbi:MAG TPA: LysR family transcriptional regulator substrate-binding protein, partial [Kofleriaceae bacterium]
FPSAAELLLPGLLDRMRAYDAIDLQIEDRDVPQHEFAGLVADFDLVVAHRSDDAVPPDREAVGLVPLFREPLDVAVPLAHPLASRDRVSVDDVIGESWIGVPEDYPIDRVLQTMAMQSGVHAQVVYRTTHLPLIENLVAAEQGLALVPRYTSRQRAAGRFALVALASVHAWRIVEALVRPDRAPRNVVQCVLAELVAEAANVTTR